MRIRRRSESFLQKRARRGFRGHPLATIAFYRPTGDRASKVAVGIVLSDDEDPSTMERWLTAETDARSDPAILAAVQEFLLRHQVKSVVMSDGLLGCPHEEGVDYPEGQSCPQCPYWAGRDRFTREKAH